MSSLAFSYANWNMGLMKQVLRADLEELTLYEENRINDLADAMDVLKFREHYPREEVRRLNEVRELFGEYFDPNDSQLWNKLLENFIFPTARKLARFTLEYEDPEKNHFFRSQKEAWNRVVQNIAHWAIIPHMPNIYAELSSDPEKAETANFA